MSVRKLHMLFAPTGLSFCEWLHRQRIAEARSLLANPAMVDRSVTEIALSVGFNDVSTFYRVFRAESGVTPGDYRVEAR